MPLLSPYSLTGLRAAIAAAEIHRASFGRVVRVDYKGLNDVVTDADRAAEAAIIETIREGYPDHGVLGEEGGRRGGGPFTWLIDPLDGTFNYARAIPWFAVSIALEHEGQILAGVVLHSILGEAYAADRGAGAWTASLRDLPAGSGRWEDPARWRPIRVRPTGRLSEAVLSTGFPNNVGETRSNVDHFNHLVLGAAKVRAFGSAALCLAGVALGRLDGFWELGLNAWDLAAGALLVEEAGGRVTDFRGRPLDVHGGQILATNGRIHDEVVGVLGAGRSGLD